MRASALAPNTPYDKQNRSRTDPPCRDARSRVRCVDHRPERLQDRERGDSLFAAGCRRFGRSGEDGLERDADDRQPAGQPVERERAQVVLGDAEHGGRVAVARQLQRVGDVGSRSRSVCADDVGLLGVLADGLAQEPDAVADVAGLVVVDLRVALDEPGQQPVVVRGSR